MKKLFLATSVLGFIALANPVKAQVDEKNDLKEEKIKAEKAQKEKKESQVIVIRKKGDKDISIKVEVKGDKITINGKPLEEFKDDNVTINKKKMTMWGGDDMMELAFDNDALSRMPLTMAGVPWSGDDKEIKRTFLGVTTNGTDDGAEITNITKGSGAEKAGLKEGDLIYKIDDAKVQSPNDLSEYITSKKPNDVVTIYFKRDGKESSAKATLGERSDKGVRAFSFSGPGQGMGNSFSYTIPAMPDMKVEDLKELARVPGMAWNNNDNPFTSQDGISYMRSARPKIGLKIQDLEEGSGVKVLDADKDSPADKAGLKKDDIITEINGKKISNTDEAREQLKPEEGKNTYTIKAKRNGTEMSFEVKIPKKLKTTNL